MLDIVVVDSTSYPWYGFPSFEFTCVLAIFVPGFPVDKACLERPVWTVEVPVPFLVVTTG